MLQCGNSAATCLDPNRRRFLVRLLLVHGSLSVYRLARLIKYSFYKNITLAFLLFMLQPFGGWSGAQLVSRSRCRPPSAWSRI